MSRLLKQVERQLKLQPKTPAPEPAPAPADTNGLGVAIQQLIDQAVHSQVEAAVQKQAPAVAEHRREFTDRPLSSTFPPPSPKAKPMPVVTMVRDRAGKIVAAQIGDLKLLVERGADGRAQRLVPQEESQL